MERLRRVGSEALRCHQILLDAWRELQESDIAELTKEDASILRSLIISRIYPINAFGLLVRIDQDAAIEVLLSLYLGINVDPDGKFGGFEFELDSMLDDLVDIGGTQSIAQLVSDDKFSIERMKDARVKRVFGEILQIEEPLVSDWIQAQRTAGK